MTRGGVRPPDSPGISASLGPERLAAILSILVIAIVGTVAIGSANEGTALQPGPSDVAPSPTQVVRSPSPTTTSGTTPPATTATWASSATTLIEIDDQIVVARDELSSALDDDATPTSLIARDLRALNSALTTALRSIDTLRTQGAPTDLVADLAAVHQAGLDAGVETLQSSLQNAPAYREGGADVVAALAGIEALVTRLRTEAGLP